MYGGVTISGLEKWKGEIQFDKGSRRKLTYAFCGGNLLIVYRFSGLRQRF